MLKVKPHPDYPPEEGRYLRGNDESCVAVAVVLNARAEAIPVQLQRLVHAAREGGAALAGTVQTENIGIEKIVCNIVANPNIRYVVLAGPESEGHRVGDALRRFILNGIDQSRRIIGTDAPTPLLLNLPREYIERFLRQVSLVDLQFQGDVALIHQVVTACQGQTPVEFMGYALHDPGAYPQPALGGKIVWRVTQPWAEPEDESERRAVQRAKELMEQLRALGRRRYSAG